MRVGCEKWLNSSQLIPIYPFISHLTRVFQARYARAMAGRRPPTPCPVRAETGTTGREPSCVGGWDWDVGVGAPAMRWRNVQMFIYFPIMHLRGEELELVPDALREGLGAAGEEVALVGRHHQGTALPAMEAGGWVRKPR